MSTAKVCSSSEQTNPAHPLLCTEKGPATAGERRSAGRGLVACGAGRELRAVPKDCVHVPLPRSPSATVRQFASNSRPPRRAAPATREAVFHERDRRVGCVNQRFTVATTPLPLLTRDGSDRAVWRITGRDRGEERRALAALPKAR
ncbi:hypothetical protein AB0E67_30900 [Streptomyces sp. NPDC032161]|uniref:hypothetical protein n=1 Tax=unclassified Streptomyces TaxID=2593676 RepID=UPI0033EB41B8